MRALGLMLPPAARTCAEALRLQRRYLVLTGAALLAVCVVAAALWPKSWRAEATVLIVPQNVPDQYVSSVSTIHFQERLASISKQVLSAGRLEKLIAAHGLYPRQRRFLTFEEVIQRMRRDVQIDLDRAWARGNTGAFVVRYTADSPRLAVEISSRLASFFIEENYRNREDNASGTSEFLADSVARTAQELQGLEQKLTVYKQTHQGALPQQGAALETRLAEALRGERLAEGQRESARQLLLETEGLLLALEGMAARPPAVEPPRQEAASPAPPPDPEITSLRKAVAALELRLSPQHPEVIAAREQLSMRERLSSPAPRTAGAPPAPAAPAVAYLPPELAARLSALRSRRAQLVEMVRRSETEQARFRDDSAALRAQISALPAVEQGLETLLRDYDVRRNHYQALLNKKMNAEMAADLERRQKAERFVLLDAPRLPEKSRGPGRFVLFLLLAGFAVVLCAALGLLRELRRQRLLGTWELPPGVPVLAALPSSGGSPAPAIAMRWWELVTPPAAGLLVFGAVYLFRTGVL